MATRRERVVMDLESNVPEEMLKGAAATAVLRAELRRLSGDYDRLSKVSVQSSRASQAISKDLDTVSKSSDRADKSINQLTGRLRLFADLAAILGPSLVPLGGAGLAGLMALTAQMGSAAIAGGVLIGSVQGVGDAVKALHESGLEPTAENLAELDKVMARLSPAAREFAREAYGLLPVLKSLRDTGATNLFPGLVASIDNLELLQSELERIMRTNGRVVGNMAEDITESLASERWAEFFQFIATDGPQAVRQLTQTVGALTHGLAELWMAFDPVNDDAGSWMRGLARDFDAWASKLDQTQGFEDFVDYLHTTGPQVEDMLGSLFNALVQIVQAAAPLGGPVLQGMTALLDTLAAIAGSDVGPTLMAAVTAMALLTRATSLYDKAAGSAFAGHLSNIRGLGAALDVTARNQQRASMSVEAFAAAEQKRAGAVKAGLGSLGKSAALMGGLAVASSGAADSIGLTNTISLGLMGTMAGPWGAAVGGAIGLAIDLGTSHDDASKRVADLTATFDAQTGAITENTRAKINGQAQDSGLLDAAEQLGLAASTVTDAIMGNAEAQQLLNDAVAGYQVDNSITSVEDLSKAYSDQEIKTILAARAATLLRNEVPGLTTEFSSAAKEAAQFGRGMDSTAEAAAAAESEVEAFTTAVARLNRLLSTRAGLRDYQQSLDDFTKSMKENGRNWDINTQKGRDNQAALDDIFGTSLKVAEGLRGAARQRFLTGAIADLREAADKWDIPREQVRNLMRELREAAGIRVRPVIDADTVKAMSAIDRVRNALAGLKDKSITVRVTQTGASTTSTMGPQAPGAAAGTFVPKTGKPYADRHLYLLADGEGVTTNRRGETDRFRDVISGINAGLSRSMVRGMLADGGVVGSRDRKDGKPKASAGFFAIDRTDALQSAIDRLGLVLEDQTRAVEDQTRRTDEWSQRMADVAQATVAGFSTGLFDNNANPLANLTKDIAGLQVRQTLQTQLVGMGLSEDALAALLSQAQGTRGNTQIANLINGGQIPQYEQLYNQAAALRSSVGAYGAQAAFGKQQEAALTEQREATSAARGTQMAMVTLNSRMERVEQHLEQMNNDGPERTGTATARALDNVAADATRNGGSRGGPTGGRWSPR